MYTKLELDFIEYAKSVAAKTPANGTKRYLYIPHRNREIYSESVVPYSMSAVFHAERRYGIAMDLYYVWAFDRLDRWGYVEPYDDYEEAIKIMQMIAEAKKKLAQPEDLSIIEKNMPLISPSPSNTMKMTIGGTPVAIVTKADMYMQQMQRLANQARRVAKQVRYLAKIMRNTAPPTRTKKGRLRHPVKPAKRIIIKRIK